MVQKNTPWKSKPDLEPVSESWIFQNFETRDTKNHKFSKFKKFVSSEFSLKLILKTQKKSKKWIFCVLDRFPWPLSGAFTIK